MKRKISKSNDSLASLNARLDEIRMSGHERLMAKAYLARAEAVADAMTAMAGAIRRWYDRSNESVARRWRYLQG